MSCTSDNQKDFLELRAPGITEGGREKAGTLVIDPENIPPIVKERTKNSSCPWINAYYYKLRELKGLKETPQT